ncbi:MAG: manganese efflux pump [Lachnospiraceae bacterium]|nr:manganese efflux pump [Lachnospiraceae bacterium]
MQLGVRFFVSSILLGVGLAMDAFSVSLANGLNEPAMKKKRMCAIAGVFAFFQAFMPMTGWLCVHTMLRYFKIFEPMIPWIALGLLAFIGGKMLVEGIRGDEEDVRRGTLTPWILFVQGIATSIDALSVGFTIADYNFGQALLASGMIALVTFIICMAGLRIGKKCGTKLSDKASVLGGVILIGIGIEIFITGVFF